MSDDIFKPTMTREEMLNWKTTPIKDMINYDIPKYKFGTYHKDDLWTEYDWYIIDTGTNQIVDNVVGMNLSEIRQWCDRWNNGDFEHILETRKQKNEKL